jgi:hypothetical protein
MPELTPTSNRRIDLVYVVHREALSSVFHSQVFTPLALQARRFRVWLVVLTPIGQLLRSPWRDRLRELKTMAARVPNFSQHLLASPPTRARWIWSDAAVLERWLCRTFPRGAQIVLQARNADAFNLAARASRRFTSARLIYDTAAARCRASIYKSKG